MRRRLEKERARNTELISKQTDERLGIWLTGNIQAIAELYRRKRQVQDAFRWRLADLQYHIKQVSEWEGEGGATYGFEG